MSERVDTVTFVISGSQDADKFEDYRVGVHLIGEDHTVVGALLTISQNDDAVVGLRLTLMEAEVLGRALLQVRNDLP